MVADSFFVQWYGPYCFIGSEAENVFANAIGEKRGVYLWTIPFYGKYMVCYVGETGVSFAERLLQHVQSYLNGFYRVFDPEEFAEGRKILVWGANPREKSSAKAQAKHQFARKTSPQRQF
jgi:hypothetical protein